MLMDFFREVSQPQKYRFSCLVQLLRIRFHKMLHFISQFL